ncbi:MAG TPA: DUF2939 domain-containing protein [Caulobacteraceae bacterium]|jgi:hypothetical protein
MLRPLAFALCLFVLSACATVERVDAAADVHAFLIAVRDGDRAAFDRHVDRPALKAQLRSRVIEEGARHGGPQSFAAGAAVLAGPLVDAGVDALVQPQVFRAAARLAGYGPETAIPNPLIISRELRNLPGGRACVVIDRQCSFVFKNEDGVWRLIAFEGDLGAMRRRIGR